MKRTQPVRPKRTFVLGVRVDADTKLAIDKAATLERRPVSQWMARKIQDALKGRENE
jgi:uncharacterized protein (DUF1778 family)